MTSLSVIIPSFNQQEYLPDAIESVLSNTRLPDEIIIVDDGSTDHSLDIAKTYQSSRTRVIHQINKGLASARNTGIMNATSDYILPLDADDLINENCIEKMIEAIEKTHADIIAPSFKAFGKHNHHVILADSLTVKDFVHDNRVPYCSAIRRTRLLEIGGYNPRMVYGYEDWALWINLLQNGASIVTMKDVLFLYRTKEISMLTNAQQHDGELRQRIKYDFPSLYE